MRTLEREGVVVGDSLSFVLIKDDVGDLVSVHIYGRIDCAHGITINVEKWLAASGNEVRGSEYSYQAFLRDPERDILRYDNAHGPLHRHFFDGQGHDVGQQELGFDDFPTLDQVIREAVRLVAEE